MSSSSRSDPAPVALVVGSELTLRDAAIAELREQALGGGPRDFNEDRFDLAAAGVDPRAIASACRTLPVLSQRRLVIVSGLEDRKAQRFMERELLEYLEDPNLSTSLVLVAEKANRRSKWVRRVSELGRVIECDAPRRPADVEQWIQSRFQLAGKRVARTPTRALFELVGNDLDRLAFEIDKACLYVGTADEVGVDDIAAVTASLRPLAIWELTDAIGEREKALALRVLSRLAAQGESPLLVLAALANHFRRLLRAHDCRPLEPRRIQQALGLHPFAARKLAAQAKSFDPPRVRQCLALVREADDALKGALLVPEKQVLEQLVLRVC